MRLTSMPRTAGRRRRRTLATIAALAVAVSMSVLAAPIALAADGPYTIDGNVPDPAPPSCPTRSGT